MKNLKIPDDIEIIDPYPADNGAWRTQEEWIREYNTQKKAFEGKRIINLSDLLKLTKRRGPKYTPFTLRNLRKSCQDYYVVTGTHNSYDKETLTGKVVHNYQSRVMPPKIIKLDEIPILEGVSADDVAKTQSGRLYFRALADDPYAKPSVVLRNLEALTNKDPKNILFYTPAREKRKETVEGSVVLFDDQEEDIFQISAYDESTTNGEMTFNVWFSPAPKGMVQFILDFC